MTSENIGGDPLNVAATEADNQPVAQTPAVEAEASLPVIDEQAETEESQPEAPEPQPEILETEAEEPQVEQPVVEADASQPEVPEPQPEALEAEVEQPAVEAEVSPAVVDEPAETEEPQPPAPEPQPDILEAEPEEPQVEQPIVEPEQPQPEAVEVDDVLVDEQPAVEAPAPQPEILEAEVEAEELQVEQPVVEPEQPQPEAVEVDDVLVDEQPAVEAAQPVRPNRLRRALGAVALLVAVAGTAFGAAYAYDQLTDEDAVETTITEDEPVTTTTAAATIITFENNSVTNQDNRVIVDCGNNMTGSDNVVLCDGVVANSGIEQSVPVVITAAEDDANRPAEITVIDNSQTVFSNTSETDCGNDMAGTDNVVLCSGVANPVIEQSPTPAEADEVEESKPQPEIKVVQKVIQAADESVTQKVTVEEDKGIEVVQEVVKPIEIKPIEIKPIEIKPIEKEPAPTEDEEKCYSGNQEVDCPW